MYKICIAAVLFFTGGCMLPSQNKEVATSDKVAPDTLHANSDDSLIALEKASEAGPGINGELVGQIDYKVRTKDVKNYEDGIINWISLEYPEKEIKQLIGKDSIVITEQKVTIIIDYPLTIQHTFDLVSQQGFTKRQLVEAISKEYHKIYKEEEATAKTKTLPLAQRKMYNRNQTDGKYGIWGHDLGDLVLDDILVYKTKNGNLILSLEIES